VDEWKLEPARDLGVPLAKRPLDLRRETGLLETGAHLAWFVFLRAYFAIWHRLRVEGRKNLPMETPFVIAANHASHLDASVLANPLSWKLRDRIFPLAAGDVFFETPVLAGFAAFVVNALPLWRRNCGAHAMETLRSRLVEERCVYILFPEGTRTRTGAPNRFRPGLGMLVAGTSVPVIPCHIEGARRALPPGLLLPRPTRLTLRIGAPLLFENEPNDRDGWIRVAGAAEAAVTALANPEPRISPGREQRP
jgi:1-acyl-sn-glycerol-3-phosphate acyltransferase